MRNSSIAFLAVALCYQLGCSTATDPDPVDPPGPVACSTTPGSICTWAGTGKAAFDGDDNKLRESFLYFPADLEFTSSGAYVLDWNNHKVRRVTPQNTFETVIGTDLVGDGDPAFADRNPPGAAGTDVALNHPTDIDELPNGNILLSAWHNHKLREYDPVTRMVVVTCGEGAGYGGDGGPVRDALLNQPTQSVIASDGTIYVLDQRNQRIRKISTGAVISTVVGTGVAGFSGDGGPPVDAQLNFPAGGNPPVSGAVELDAQGRLYISDTLNHRIRRVDFGANTIETIAGNGIAGFGGDGSAAVNASLNNPRDIEIGPDGRLYIVDEKNHRIRAVDLTTGIITTVAGNGNQGAKGDGGPATAAELNFPGGLAFDAAGYMYIADTFNHKIRRVSP